MLVGNSATIKAGTIVLGWAILLEQSQELLLFDGFLVHSRNTDEIAR